MADKKISELTELVTPATDDELAIVDKDVVETKKIKTGNLRDHAPKSHGNEAHEKVFIEGTDVPANETDPNVDATLKGVTKTEVQDHVPKSHANEAHTKTFIEGSEVPVNETDPNVDVSLKGVTKAQVQDHAPKSHGNAAHSPAFLPGVIVKTTDDQSNSTVTLADVTDLAFSLNANKDYLFEFIVVFQTAATTTGIRLDIIGPTTPTFIVWWREIPLAAQTAGTYNIQHRQLVAYQGDAATASIGVANQNFVARIIGVISNGVNAGDLKLQFASEVADSAVIIKKGSFGRLFN